MNTPLIDPPRVHAMFQDCAEELLFHTSRYYAYTERFLAALAGKPSFSMTGYDARALSTDQRRVLTGLMSETPSREVARGLVAIIEDVIKGEKGVDRQLAQRYKGVPISAGRRYCPRRVGGAKGLPERAVAAVDPIQNIAARLHIPIEVRGRKVRMPLELLRKHLDSPNPTIRNNIHNALVTLHQGGYRLVNTPYHPRKRIDWSRHRSRFSPYAIAWQLFHRWLHQHRQKSFPV